MEINEAMKICARHDWAARTNPKGLWTVGIEKKEGIEVLGMGINFIQAVKNAMEATNGKEN